MNRLCRAGDDFRASALHRFVRETLRFARVSGTPIRVLKDTP